MNKYIKEARSARAEGKRRRMCTDKVAFDSAEDAFQKNQRSYKCPHCKKWHRSGSFMKFVRKLEHTNER